MTRIDTTKLDADIDDVLRRQSKLEEYLSNQLSMAVADLRAEMATLPRPKVHDGTGKPGDGIISDNPFGRVENWSIRNVAGIGAMATNREGQWPDGCTRAMFVRDNEIWNTYRGIVTEVSDTRVSNNMIVGSRDYGLHVGRGPGGTDASGVKSIFNHSYGARVACYVESSGFSSTEDEYADAAYGYHGGPLSWNSRLNAPTIFHCWERCLKLEGKHEVIGGVFDVWQRAKIHSDTAGIEILAADCQFLGGKVIANWTFNPNDTEHKACIASMILGKGADRLTVHKMRFEGRPGMDGQRGILVTGPVNGGEIDVDVTGYVNPGDIFFETRSPGVRNLTVNMRGPKGQKPIKLHSDTDKSNRIYFNGEKVWG
jgi:hypothetical protein